LISLGLDPSVEGGLWKTNTCVYFLQLHFCRRSSVGWVPPLRRSVGLVEFADSAELEEVVVVVEVDEVEAAVAEVEVLEVEV
jgi:hypothetical protein